MVPDDSIGLIRYILAEGRLEQILALPEAPKRAVYAQRTGRNRPTIATSIEELLIDWVRGAELVEIANKHLALVTDIDYRFEQLGDLLNQYFEIFFPWVFGTVIAWTNQFLVDDGFVNLLPRIIPAYVRWGVGNPPAVELMSKGMTSRTLAMRIANRWLMEKTEHDIMTWLRQLGLAQWQEFFSASVTDLRLLLEFCRDQKGGAAAELLSTGTTSVSAETPLSELRQSEAALMPIDQTELSSIGIWINHELVGKVASRDQADIQAIVSSGLDYSATFSVISGVGNLRIDLANPEEES